MSRLTVIRRMPCICCVLQRCEQPLRTEAHHLVDKGNREASGGDEATIPLCQWHHRGELVYPLSSREMKMLYGPSLARSKREFKLVYGNERSLLLLTNKDLESRVAA